MTDAAFKANFGATTDLVGWGVAQVESAPGWLAVMRFERIGGEVRMTGFELVPEAKGTTLSGPGGDTTTQDLGFKRKTPPDQPEVTSGLLAGLGLADLRRAALEKAAKANLTFFEGGEVPKGRRAPGKESVRHRQARRAARYVDLVNLGHDSPNAVIAAEEGVPRKQIENDIAAARSAEPPLLTRPQRKRQPGGELTDTARRILEEN